MFVLEFSRAEVVLSRSGRVREHRLFGISISHGQKEGSLRKSGAEELRGRCSVLAVAVAARHWTVIAVPGTKGNGHSHATSTDRITFPPQIPFA